MKNEVLWRVERKRGHYWILAASFSLPSGSREEGALAHFRQMFPLFGDGEYRARRVV